MNEQTTPSPSPPAPPPTPRQAAFASLMFGPGAGQFLLGRRLRGFLFLSVFLVSLLQIVWQLGGVALKHWPALSVRPDAVTLQAFVGEALATDAGPLGQLVVLLWMVSMVDAWVMAYALARRSEDAAGNPQFSIAGPADPERDAAEHDTANLTPTGDGPPG